MEPGVKVSVPTLKKHGASKSGQNSKGSKSNGTTATQTTSRRQDKILRLKSVVTVKGEREERVSGPNGKGGGSIENIEAVGKRLATKVKERNERNG